MAKTITTGNGFSVQLVNVNLNSPPPQLTLDNLGPQHDGFTYNAMAYNPKDDFLYAIKQSVPSGGLGSGADDKDLIRIGPDAAPKYVATLHDLEAKAIVAEFDQDGFFHVVDELRNYYKYDLNGSTPQLVGGVVPLALSGPATSFQDFGLYNGYLWAVAAAVSGGSGGGSTSYRILRIPLTGAPVPEVGPTRSISGQQMSFTSVFAARNGIYAYDTASGNFVKIDMSSNDITQMELQFLAKGETLPGSDGAKCQNAPLGLPAEIVVSKSSPQSVLVPGQPVNFTITVDNMGPWGAVGIAFSDPLPSGATSATWSCTTSAPTARCDPASGTGPISATLELPERNQSITFQLTVQTDTGAANDLVNTASVTVPEDFADDAANNTATATVPLPSVDFTTTKAGTLMGQGGSFTAAGDAISYTVTVRNDSNVPFTSVTVSDPGPLFGGVAGTGAMSAFQPASATLAPDEEKAFTASYTITEQDLANLAAGGTVDVVNTAIVTATAQSGIASSQEATATVQVIAPAIHLEKTGVFVDELGEPAADVGDRIDYTLTITNTGSVALENIVLSDPFVSYLALDQSDLDANGILMPGKTVTYRASHIITGEDLTLGEVINSAIVTANVAGRPDLPAVEHFDDHVEALAASSSILVEKFAESRGILKPRDPIIYTVRLTNAGVLTLSEVYPVDEGPTFGGQPGTGTLSPFEPGPVSLGPGETAEFSAVYTLSESDVLNAVEPDSIRNVATATGLKPDGSPVDRAYVAEAVLSPTTVHVTKMAPLRKAWRGGSVPFVLTVEAPGAKEPVLLDLVDTMPVGFTYLANSARMNGKAVEPRVQGRRLVFPLRLSPDEKVELSLQLFVTGAVNPGEHTNVSHAELSETGFPVGNPASATVEVELEHVFDCGDLVGKVFADSNRNGVQDQDEPGVAGARLVAVDGVILTTDSSGRFHLTCADLPDRRKGTSFMLKLDPRSLPSGHRIVSENPRTVRLTAGKVTALNFATSVTRVVRVDINSDAFHMGEVLLRQEWHPRLLQLITILKDEPSILRVSYIDRDLDRGLAARRLDFLRDLIRQLWADRSGGYKLEIESRILNQMGQGWDEPNSISWIVEPQHSGQVLEFER